MNQVALHPLVQQHYDLLAQACNSVASYQLRNRATIGGNCCNASPAADTAPALFCLDAVAEIFGPTALAASPSTSSSRARAAPRYAAGEFLTGIHLPPHPPERCGVFNKLGRTKIGDISMVSVAVYCLDRRRREPRHGASPWALWGRPLCARRKPKRSLPRRHLGWRRSARPPSWPPPPPDPSTTSGASAAYRRAMVRVLARRGIEIGASASVAGRQSSAWRRA